MNPHSTDITSQSVTSRSITHLHRDMGARRMIIKQASLLANIPLTLANFNFSSVTIDRIVGVFVNLANGNTAPVGWTLQDLDGGWRLDQNCTAHPGAYWFNIDTLTDGLNLVFQANANLVNLQFTLYNYEIMPASMGSV